MQIFNLILVVLLALSLLIINLVYFSFKHIKAAFSNVNRKTWVLLLLIFFGGLFLRMFVTTHMHNLYFDEDGYMDVAKHIANNANNCLCLKNTDGVCDICGYSFKSVGFSFLLAIAFKIFGASHATAFNTGMLLGSLTILTMFFFSYLLFKDEKTALLSALILAFYPLHVRWSGSVSAEVASLFFITITFSCLALYKQSNKIILLVLSLLSLAYTITVKEENILLALFFAMFFLSKKKYRQILLAILAVVLIALLPYLIGSYMFHADTGTSVENFSQRYTFWKEGKFLSFEFLKKDFPTNMSFWIDRNYTMHIIIALNFLGMFYMWKKSKGLCALFLLWPIMIISLFSAYIGMPLIQSEVRHYLPILVSIAIFSSYSMASLSRESLLKKFRLEYILVGIILVSTIIYLPYITSVESPVQSVQNDHETIEKTLDIVPKECTILTQESYLYDFFDRSAATIYIPLPEGIDKKCLYYYEGEVCWRKEAYNLCKEFRKKAKLSEPLTSDGRHALYKITELVR